MKKDLKELKKEYVAQALRKVEEGKGFSWTEKEIPCSSGCSQFHRWDSHSKPLGAIGRGGCQTLL